jgi:predicted RNA-binding Zn-ribbon protein involved in translation (DUF1610 family)
MNREMQEKLLDLKARQGAGEHMPCPRCGQSTMSERVTTNALSRHTDLYVCDECGTVEALLIMMKNPLPMEDWACFSQDVLDLQAPSAEDYLDTVTQKHTGYLKTLFERWQDEKGYEDFREYRMAAKGYCPSLTELWDQPFQAVYRCQDGSRIIVRFKQTQEGTEVAVDTLPK